MDQPIVIDTENEKPSRYLDMPEGLEGYWWETENLICIPVVISKNEGRGVFGKFLKEVEAKNKPVFFPTIVSARLDSILQARGYKLAITKDEFLGIVDGLYLPAP